ncbi:MAG: cytochrome c [Sulfurovum sp.]|nr:cytochrome c [Sulfurovum sp.]MCB4749466.1 cytochrome c [Sulfurovum sp.]MCB4762542.1 cytochrome c [Sulfurovum sp.]MCB4764427.1 cytochrome c [Sulfurovum sp.]MCB4772903.1 cytochrome c [Sulfurovum sp.]
MLKYIFLVLPLLLLAEEDFISHYEYGQMLYNNPRGVSCAQCHGKSGEGKVIVSFWDTDGKKALKGPDIRLNTLKQMITSVNIYHPVMPHYYLTDEEVKVIYDYLQKKNATYIHTHRNRR